MTLAIVQKIECREARMKIGGGVIRLLQKPKQEVNGGLDLGVSGRHVKNIF